MLTNLPIDLPFTPDFGVSLDPDAPVDQRLTQLEDQVAKLREEHRRLMEAIKSVFDNLNGEGVLQIGDATIDGSPIGEHNASTGRFTSGHFSGNVAMGGDYTYPAHLYMAGNITTASGKPTYGIAIYDNVVGLDAGQAYCTFNAEPTISNVAALGHVINFQTYCRNGANTTNYYAFSSILQQTAGTSTNVYHYYVTDLGGAGSATNQYGVYVEELVKGGTVNWAIYTAGATPSHFGGDTEIGDGTAARVLKVSGSSSGSGGGGVVGVYNGTLKAALGNYSAILGGAYNAAAVVYSASDLYLAPANDSICGLAALATNATKGFLFIPSCAGTPTGTPTTHTGTVALVYDTTNNKLYAYNGAWKSATFA